jgi:stromal membrane-associated protein
VSAVVLSTRLSGLTRLQDPRWASWNLGVFICIRCSGIHRGMGTHISRVKSVDLDSWTDEQLKSILSWGNARANKYWEAKLAPGHVPSEAKIENFIRTKYELKRWVMDGPMPDPATLDIEGDDDIPLSLVKEKQIIERKVSVRNTMNGRTARAVPQPDLIGGDDIPPRSSTAGPSHIASKATPAPPKHTTAKDSLFGLDFLSDSPSGPPRPASTTGTPGSSGGQSRPDLKQSILSLYASAPKPQPQHGHTASGSISSFGGLGSPMQSPTNQTIGGNGLDDAFAGLSFGNVPPPKSPPKDAFAGLSAMSSNRPTPHATSSISNLSGGSFFDARPAKPAAPPQQQQQQQQHQFASASADILGGWGAPAAPVAPARPVQQPSTSSFGDLFDLSAPAPAPQAAAIPSPPLASPRPAMGSVFNLSQPKPTPAPVPAAAPMPGMNPPALDNPWGNAWSEPAAAPAPATKAPETSKPSGFGGSDFGWGSTGGSFASQSIVPGKSGGFSPAPKVAADEEFGGWTSSTGANTSNGAAKPSGGFGNDDLFSNVWQ